MLKDLNEGLIVELNNRVLLQDDLIESLRNANEVLRKEVMKYRKAETVKAADPTKAVMDLMDDMDKITNKNPKIKYAEVFGAGKVLTAMGLMSEADFSDLIGKASGRYFF